MKLVKRFLKSFGKKKESYEKPAGQGGMRSGKVWWRWKEGVRTQVRKYTCLTKDKKYFKMRSNASSKCRSRANEIKEMEHKKTEEALNLVKKENDLWMYKK